MSKQIIHHSVSDEKFNDEITLLDLAITLAKYKKSIIGGPLLVGILTAIYTMFIPPVYTSDTVILPPQQQAGTAAMLASQLGAIGGGSAMLGIKNPNDIYVALLKSRTIQDHMAMRYGLARVYQTNSPAQTRSVLAGATSIVAGKDGLITISIDDHEPMRAALLANGYVEELQKLTQILAVTEASQRRLFYEKQLFQVKQQLSDAEIILKQTQETTGLIQLDAQAAGLVQASASIKAQIAMKEVQLGAMRTFATGNNPDYIRAQKELGELRTQLDKVETGSVTTGKAPSAGLEYLRKVRDVKYYETIYDFLAKQLEMAKLDEAKQSSIIQIIDKADVPEIRSKPKRGKIVIIALFISFVIAVLAVFVKVSFEKVKNNSNQDARLKQLVALLGLRR